MASSEPLCHLVGIPVNKLTKEEYQLLEAELFFQICKELKEYFRKQNKEYFHLMKFNLEKENKMLESNFVCLIIQDILSTDEYNISGIARYTDTHEDVIDEVLNGRNSNPSGNFLQRVIDLHRSVRRELYAAIIKKITERHLALV